MTSVPMASIAVFISRACTSPPWFSHASFTPESTMRERRPRTALTMVSRTIGNISGVSEARSQTRSHVLPFSAPGTAQHICALQ